MIEVLEQPALRQLVHPFTVEEYHSLAGNKRTELIEGIVFNKMPKSPLHASSLRQLFEFFRLALSGKYAVLKEDPITLESSEPEPDLTIVDPPAGDSASHPKIAHLVVEISVTTKIYDATKAGIYAKGNIPIYWNILPEERMTVEYSGPKDGVYSVKREVPFDSTLVAALPEQSIEVCLSEILADLPDSRS